MRFLTLTVLCLGLIVRGDALSRGTYLRYYKDNKYSWRHKTTTIPSNDGRCLRYQKVGDNHNNRFTLEERTQNNGDGSVRRIEPTFKVKNWTVTFSSRHGTSPASMTFTDSRDSSSTTYVFVHLNPEEKCYVIKYSRQSGGRVETMNNDDAGVKRGSRRQRRGRSETV
ncbi:uncharacterized protein LOC142584938 [Dermacentor variabilis]|uniref:uncharacterized protein LOC142584938 n=1 Tax=Dermacentor variabilis TaxID=34621 RepID=UPI003F5C6176